MSKESERKKKWEARKKRRLKVYGRATETIVTDISPQGRIDCLQDLFIDLKDNLTLLENFIEWLVRVEHERQEKLKIVAKHSLNLAGKLMEVEARLESLEKKTRKL